MTKLLFGQCTLTDSEAPTNVNPGTLRFVDCTISGVDSDDSALATFRTGNGCFDVAQAIPTSGDVSVRLRNNCSSAVSIGSGGGTIPVLVYDK